MKLTITTLVIVEGSYIQGIFHSLEEHPGKAYQELVDQVENEYGYDADKDHVPLHFKTIQDDEQDEDMISQYTNIYNAIEKWESDHRETEIFQQLAVSELFNQLNK